MDEKIQFNNLVLCDEDNISFLRITALWAFSESAFGGILHALSIPFRGLFISSAAVLFISLISLFSKSKKNILNATLIVILIKAVVSPHTPLTAYLAVSLQGILGYLFFFSKKFYKVSALILGIAVLIFSGIQKIVVLTILFGTTLWESLDVFMKQISIDFLGINNPEINYGYLLITFYVLLHLIAGLFIGIYAGNLPKKINYYKSIIPAKFEFTGENQIPSTEKQRKKIWFLRPTGIFVILLSIGVIILSYLSPGLDKSISFSVVTMLLRSFVIIFIWYAFLAPIVGKLFQKFISKRKSEYSKYLEEIISMFPKFREIVNYSWNVSKEKKGINRIRYFLSTSFYYLLLSN